MAERKTIDQESGIGIGPPTEPSGAVALAGQSFRPDGPERSRVEWVALGLRRAAREDGVELPLAYAQAMVGGAHAAGDELGLTRLGTGIVIHTVPGSSDRLPIVLGFADRDGQWYHDGRRHHTPDDQRHELEGSLS